ncbi:hypothetical protein Trichorick_01685 (plasmid) [Candidatus Trichorickettsia mobilis]|uniref:hypothetical protein n=1 Tax=Candidatus Trichorickettsia mobilis TaxID=1346319 RepID=UPI002B258D44|nr:hypothetical protein [Candidatus Trichorickettsia mobilis]WPY01767.1 hypothetical protein Trichorick_01685 [Candidatus Trichorickettsia mobilis]
MKKIDETPIIYTKTNTNQKKCDLVEDLGGNKYQLCREPQKTITTGFNKPSKPTFVVDNIDTFNNKPVEIKQFYNPSPLDYSPYNSLPTSYQPTPQQSIQQYPSNLPFEINMDFENKEFMRLGPEKYQSRSYVISALYKVKQGELNTSSPFPPITDITLEHLRNGVEEALKSTEGIVDIALHAVGGVFTGAFAGMKIGVRLGGNPYVIGGLTVLGGIIGAITGGLVGLKEVGVYGGAEVVGEVIKAQEKLKSQEPVVQKKNEVLNTNKLYKGEYGLLGKLDVQGVTGHGYTPRTEEAHVYDSNDNLIKIPVSPKRMAVWLNDLKNNPGRFETTFYDKKMWSRPSYDPYMKRI